MCHIVPMPDMNIRQLRNTRQLKAWLRAGRTVELRERKRVIARIVPERLFPQTRTWPNFAARVRKIFGDRMLPGADLLAEDRDRY
jgi:antitoxin (DNA-binding transcriptional repressor) of toxin-antitoxin stability system